MTLLPSLQLCSLAAVWRGDSCHCCSDTLNLPQDSQGACQPPPSNTQGPYCTHKVTGSHRTIHSHCTYTHAGALAQYSNSLRAAVGPVRAAVFVKHRVTPAPEQQSNPAYPPRPHTHTHTQSKSGSSPLSSCLSLFSSNSFAFCHSMTDSSLKCSTFSSSLSPSSLHSLHNFHTGGTRGFLIACLWKHNLFPPSSAGASSCGFGSLPAVRQTDGSSDYCLCFS